MIDRNVQVLLYTSYLHIIGGIETFVYNFVELMSPYYDLGLYCPGIPPKMAAKLSLKIPVFQSDKEITCDTLIMIRIMDKIPKNVIYKHSIRMCHACKSNPAWKILPDCEKVVHVSEASKKSFQSDGEVIYNPLIPKVEKKALLIVSATRIPAQDKGLNTDRMIRLAEMLNEKGIKFLWFNFSDVPLHNAPKGLVNAGAFEDMRPYIKRADYLVQLSDQEGFGYTIIEALTSGTAVICTPFETTKELGVIDGKNGYVVPFDMGFDVEKLLKVPRFKYTYSNNAIVEHWKQLLGDSEPSHNYVIDDSVVLVEVLRSYRDNKLNRLLNPGEVIKMTQDRADYVMERLDGYIRIAEG